MFDKDAYRRAVLDPARALGNTPPPDLLVRYGLRGSPRPGPAELDEHLAQVVAYWRTLKQQKRTYAKLVDALLAGHSELARAGLLTWEGLNEETRRRVAAAEDRLAETVRGLATTTSLISRAAFDHLVADTGGACSEARVRKVLADHGVGVAERSWELPDAGPLPAYRTLRDALGKLGLRLSAEAVVGADAVRRGFRLRDGFRLTTASAAGPAGPLTEDMIAAAIRRSAGRARDEGKAATDGVLSVLAEAAREPGRLDALLLWEVMEILRPQAEAGLPAKVLAARAAELGLVREEADELALAMLDRGGRPAGAAGRVREALQDGRLRAAERLLSALPAEEERDLRAEVEEKARQVAAWTEQAARERAAGRTEAAAELLDRASRVAADDDAIADRLRALPPPPPGDVRVGVQDGRVSVAWTPGAVRVGPVRYRVVRTVGAPAGGASAGAAIGETDANELVDRDPPPAEELYYSVFAGRAEGVWSAPAAGRPVTVLPEVGDVSVRAEERQVAVTWRFPAGAAEAVVTRLDEGADQRAEGRPSRTVPADRGGFADTEVTPGRLHRYRIRVAYVRSDGSRRLSRGVVVTALPEAPPEPVRDLAVDLTEGDGPPVARITWIAPSRGRVVIRTCDERPPWPPGTRIPQEEAERYGREVPGAAARGADGRMTLTTRVDTAARSHFVAVSLGAGLAVVGASAALALVEPVRELTARRQGDTVALSWIWPSDAQLVRVAWAPVDDEAAGPAPEPEDAVEIRRRAYEDDGCRLTVGPGAARVTVRAVVRDGADELCSRPVTAFVPGTGPKVRYEFRRRRLARRGSPSAVLVLTADRPCRIPPLVVVHRAGDVLPLRPEQGEVIHKIPARDLDPDDPLVVRFKVPATPGPARLACFAAADAADAVTLIRLPGAW
ncbi:hypothetical protein Arub01_01210 [Actinomadura rubrobrunea]|uniref:SaeA second Fn3-like domain-containing protein n=1 Tax=Actinomadura rubrobrunea TaxID=115335 RepID=A0A9W6UU46_9ACTN|nr:hypothetical protein [Actinomadura rubrobrunea]GLW61877.1 hypothetical protein Arub01_01210 [Actinomadura rubrobrunea]